MKFLFLLSIISAFLVSCSGSYRFQSKNNEPNETPNTNSNPDSKTPDGSNNPLKNPNPNQPSDENHKLTYSNGACTPEGVSPLSCLNCKIKTKEPVPNLSEKALRLLNIMAQACQIKNSSDPLNKIGATKETIFKLLSQGTPEIYPDTSKTTTQTQLLASLDNNNSELYQKLFGGLWYQPPYSNDFETYFGISTFEAKSLFCFQTTTGSFSLNAYLPLQSESYIDCFYNSSTSNCKETRSYINANKFRGELQETILNSLKSPYTPGPAIPLNSCFWEKVEGEYNSDFELILLNWIRKNYKISIYYENGNPRCENFSGVTPDLKGKIKAAAYICDDF